MATLRLLGVTLEQIIISNATEGDVLPFYLRVTILTFEWLCFNFVCKARHSRLVHYSITSSNNEIANRRKTFRDHL